MCRLFSAFSRSLLFILGGLFATSFLMLNYIEAKEKISIFWAVYDGETKEYTDALQKAFNQSHSEIDLQIIRIDWNILEPKLQAYISARQEPNLAVIPSYKVLHFERQGLLEPIAPYLKPSTLNNFTFVTSLKNKIYGTPMAAGVRVLYYRKDLVSIPPTTFEEMLKIAINIHNPPDVYGIGLVGQAYKENVDFSYYLYGNGGDYFSINEDGSYGKSSVNSPEGIKALSFMNDLIHKYKVTQPDVNAYGRDEVQALFVSGKLGFFLNNTATAKILETSNVSFPWGVAALPSFQGNPPRPLQITDSIIMFRKPGHFKEVGVFLDFFYQDYWRRPFDQAIGFPPITKSLSQQFSFQKPVFQAMLKFAPSAKSYPLVEDWTAMNYILWNEFEDVFLGYQTPENALNRAARKIDQLRGMR